MGFFSLLLQRKSQQGRFGGRVSLLCSHSSLYAFPAGSFQGDIWRGSGGGGRVRALFRGTVTQMRFSPARFLYYTSEKLPSPQLLLPAGYVSLSFVRSGPFMTIILSLHLRLSVFPARRSRLCSAPWHRDPAVCLTCTLLFLEFVVYLLIYDSE